jgi:hypothetical protein
MENADPSFMQWNGKCRVVIMTSCTAGRGHQTSFTEHFSLHAQQRLKEERQNDGEDTSPD